MSAWGYEKESGIGMPVIDDLGSAVGRGRGRRDSVLTPVRSGGLLYSIKLSRRH